MTTPRLRAIPETYTFAGLKWTLVEQIANWAIYGGRGQSFEVVRTNVRAFPPPESAWGKDGFSFNGVGALERARKEVCKQLNTKGCSKCKTRYSEDNGVEGVIGPIAVPNA